MSDVIVVQSSLNKNSKTSTVALKVLNSLKNLGVKVELLDLRNFEQEWCDGRNIENYSEKTFSVFKKLSEAKAFVFCFPIYQYSYSGVFKNFIDLHGSSLSNKPYGIVLNSGGIRSYMSCVSLVNSMFLEYQTFPITPIIHSWMKDFDKTNKLINKKVVEKVKEMTQFLKKKIS